MYKIARLFLIDKFDKKNNIIPVVTRVTIFVCILSLNVPSRFCCKKMYEKNSQPLCLSVLYSKSLQSFQPFWTLNILLPVDIILHGSIWPIRHFSIKVSFLKYFLNINHSCFVLHFFYIALNCIALHCVTNLSLGETLVDFL